MKEKKEKILERSRVNTVGMLFVLHVVTQVQFQILHLVLQVSQKVMLHKKLFINLFLNDILINTRHSSAVAKSIQGF